MNTFDSINAWWENSPTERYWMEASRATSIGERLQGTQLRMDGSRSPFLTLLTFVQPGDHVLHWSKEMQSIIGTSVVAKPAISVPNTAANVSAHERWLWSVSLNQFAILEVPITIGHLRAKVAEVSAVAESLLQTFGAPTYFPFSYPKSKQLMLPKDGYMTKFPASLVDLFPSLRAHLGRHSVDPEPSSSAGFEPNPIVRRALERQSVEQASRHYQELGYKVQDVGTVAPFDLLVSKGDEVRHVEVKGTSGLARAVVLTAGEVAHAHCFQPTDLFIVEQIQCIVHKDGAAVTLPGSASVVSGWKPEIAALEPISFKYQLPYADTSTDDVARTSL